MEFFRHRKILSSRRGFYDFSQTLKHSDFLTLFASTPVQRTFSVGFLICRLPIKRRESLMTAKRFPFNFFPKAFLGEFLCRRLPMFLAPICWALAHSARPWKSRIPPFHSRTFQAPPIVCFSASANVWLSARLSSWSTKKSWAKGALISAHLPSLGMLFFRGDARPQSLGWDAAVILYY